MTRPDYAGRSVCQLLPSALASLGLPGHRDTLGLPASRHVCLLLVDGLGANLLAAHEAHAPFLASARSDGVAGGKAQVPGGPPLTAPFPSTTAASLGCLGTGRPPGQHGIVGYQSRVPGSARLLNALRWPDDVDPLAWQPYDTLFDTAEAEGADVAQIAPAEFQGSGLTRAALRGGRFIAADGTGERVAAAAAHAVGSGDAPSLTYVYYGDLDAVGHRGGIGSPAWRLQLEHVDLLARQLAASLPPGGTLLVSADHGMVDAAPDARVDLATSPALRAGVALVGGESRARHLYTEPGRAGEVADRWRAELGERAWVRTREEAIECGWFGPEVTRLVAERIGDVVVAARDRFVLVDTVAEPRESALIGVHGSLTADEMLVPLVMFTA